MEHTERPPEVRSRLRQILNEVLRCRVWPTTSKRPAPASKIIPRAPPTPPCLPQLSQLSLFPDFESDRFGDDNDCFSSVGHDATPASQLQSVCNESKLSLLPAMRLSQIDLYGLCTNHTAPLQRQNQYETLGETQMEDASQQASVSTTEYEQSLRSVSSILTIRRSARFALSESQGIFGAGAPSRPTPSLKEAAGTENLRGHSSGASSPSKSASQMKSEISNTPTHKLSSEHSSRSNASINSIRHFGSFCVLDTFVSGCPVTATSKDLRYIFQIGDQFILNIQECEGTSIDMVTGSSPDGGEVIHLVLFSPLLSPSSGTSRFILAALIDVTHFVHEASQLPELDTNSEGPSSEDENAESHSTPPQSVWSSRNYELLADDLLRGCSVPDKPHKTPANRTSYSPQTPKSSPMTGYGNSEDIWLALAREERLDRHLQMWTDNLTKESLCYKKPQSLRTASTQVSKSSTSVDEVLEEFMSSIQQLYSESFLLARSPLDDRYYEICSVSPAVHATGEYVNGHLKHTAPCVIEVMSERLGAGTPFSIIVRWGSHGIEKRLYCVPLYGESSTTWICVLVDLHIAVLW